MGKIIKILQLKKLFNEIHNSRNFNDEIRRVKSLLAVHRTLQQVKII